MQIIKVLFEEKTHTMYVIIKILAKIYEPRPRKNIETRIKREIKYKKIVRRARKKIYLRHNFYYMTSALYMCPAFFVSRFCDVIHIYNFILYVYCRTNREKVHKSIIKLILLIP